MSIQKTILDKYSKKENEVLAIKEMVAKIVEDNTGVVVDVGHIDVKEKSATLQVSSVIKSVIFEKKIEIENDLREKNSQVTHIQ